MLFTCIAKRATNTDMIAAKHVSEAEIEGLYPINVRATYAQRQSADNALMEAWQRLQAKGLIMQAPGQANGVMTITTKGREVIKNGTVEEITVRQNLRRDMLHRDIQGAVYDNFAGGHYDTAVRDAFVAVEVAVRDVSNLSRTLVGVKLMREAFNPNTGRLTNMELSMPERERMADLFAGAIGTFKNPLSHLKVGNADPAPVIEELMFASRLLRFVKP
jgi:uncharacterized protein (TIGR02391 family)